MKAQYYYVDPETRKACGPLGAEEIRGLIADRALDPATLICRVVAEEWQTGAAYPELLPPPAEPALPPPVAVVETLPVAAVVPPPVAPALPAVAAPAPRRGPRRALVMTAAILAVAAIIFYGRQADIALWRTAGLQFLPGAVGALPPAPPAATSLGDPDLGCRIAARILEQHPKLQAAVISGTTYPKPDGIELYGTGAGGASICFILPEETWGALSDGEKADLEAYVASKVEWVRDHADQYMIIPHDAPDYEKDLLRAKHLVDGSWRIGSTQSYVDDPQGNLYVKRALVRGVAY